MAASRKKGDYSVLSEINTEEEWDGLCMRKGLTIVDVYSEWSGPCSAMTNFLKKIKLEVNDDMLQYAMAKSDSIPQLEIFKGHCKPIWLFIATGEPVAVMHGANAPLLQRMIEKEIRKERQVLKGEATRESITLEEAVPAKSRCKAATNLWADTDEEDNADSVDEDAQVETNEDQSKNFAIMCVESFIYEDSDKYLTLKGFLNQEGFEVIREQDIVLTLDDIRMFTSGFTLTEDETDEIVTHLLETTVKALLVRCSENVKAIPKVSEWIGPLFKKDDPKEQADGDSTTTTPAANSDEQKKILYVDEDVTIENDLRSYFCDQSDPKKQIGLLCAEYSGFLVLMETYFLASLTSVIEGGVDKRKVMLLFLEEQQHFIMSEIGETNMSVLGTCVTMLNADKAKVIIGNERKKKRTPEDEHTLFVELSNSQILAVVVIREKEKDLRSAQNKILKELDPLVVTFHLPSMKIFFTNVITEETTESGDFLCHLDQGVSSGDEDEDETA